MGRCAVPQLAQATGMTTHDVLWHMAAMKKYGTVEETGMDDDDEYYLYRPGKGGKVMSATNATNDHDPASRSRASC